MAIIKKKPKIADGELQNTLGNLPALNVQLPQFNINGGNWNRENNPWYQQQQALMGQLSAREPYKFDVDASALYQAVKDNTIRQGQRAMQDTMGQAAGLTGGYGSTYAQGAGQQAYNEFLTRLNDQIPDIAAQERAAYDAETQALLQRLSLASNLYQQDYGEAMAERDYQHQLGREAVADEQTARDEEWRQKQFDYGVEQDALANALAQQKWDYQKEIDARDFNYGVQQDELARQQKQENEAYDRAWKLINFSLSYGTTPTDADLQAAGLTRDQFNTARALAQAQASAKGSGGNGSTPKPENNNETHTSVVPIINGPLSLSPTGQALYRSLGNITGNPFEYIMRAYQSADMPEEQKESEINYWLKVYQLKKT